MSDSEDALVAVLDSIADDRRDLPHGDWLDVRRRARIQRPRWRSRRFALLASAAALIGVGAALAAGTGTFDSISAANHPQVTRDQLTARQRALLHPPHFAGIGSLGHARLSQSRLLAVLPNRWRLYAAPDSANGVCAMLVAPRGRSGTTNCGPDLQPTRPITVAVTSLGGKPGSGRILFGIARDGVRSVTITVGGRRRTVAVHGNAYFLQANQRIDIGHVSITFTNGQHQRLS